VESCYFIVGDAEMMMIILIMMVMEISMIAEVNAVNFRQNLGEMLNQVQYRNDSIVINKDGKPVAALVDADLFARIRRMRDRFDALAKRIEEAMPKCRSRKVWLRSILWWIENERADAEFAVLDTNVLVSGLAYPGSVRGCYETLRSVARLITAPPILPA
jgi:prevent-host-death family protein